MFTELLKVTPWWVWIIVVLGALLIFFMAVVFPTVLTARGAPRGSRERKFVYQLGSWATVLVIANVVLSLADPARQMMYSSVFLFALLLLTPWVIQKQKQIRDSERKDPPKPSDLRR
jgi:L-asparagine transporter-like permease